jgi:hypothetical protein
VLGVVESATSGEVVVVVVEPGGSTLLGVVVVVVVGWTIVGVVVVVGWTIVGVVVVVVGRAIDGVIVDGAIAASPMSSSQSLAALPSSQDCDGRSPAAAGACVTTANAATTQQTRTQPMLREHSARVRTDSIVQSGMLGPCIVPPPPSRCGERF